MHRLGCARGVTDIAEARTVLSTNRIDRSTRLGAASLLLLRRVQPMLYPLSYGRVITV